MSLEKWRKANQTTVLLLFRDGLASNWASLCQAFDLKPDSASTPVARLQVIVMSLIGAKLLVASDPDFRGPTSSIKVSDHVSGFLTALNLSLKEMAATNPHESMFVEPSFGRPDSIPLDKQLDLFILMPFSPNIRGVYEDHIKNVATNLKLKVARADDFFAVHTVIRDVWTAICKSRVILADCTGRNPNVFYEIGLAHAIGKPVILITQNSEDMPFDLAHYRHIHYEFTPRGMNKFESILSNTLQAVFDELEETSW